MLFKMVEADLHRRRARQCTHWRCVSSSTPIMNKNCSTNAVRSVGSSQVDPYSAVAAQVLRRSTAHSTAPMSCARHVEADRHDRQHRELRTGVKEGRWLMGGHRVYKNYDPRAKIIKRACDDVFEVTDVNLLKIAQELEAIALEDEVLRQAQAVPQRRLLLRADL